MMKARSREPIPVMMRIPKSNRAVKRIRNPIPLEKARANRETITKLRITQKDKE